MSSSRNQRSDKPNEKSKSSVFNRLGSSKSTSEKPEICPSISKNGSCKNESNCKYYHPKSMDIESRKVKNEEKKSYKEDSKIKSAVIVSGRSIDDKYKNTGEKSDKSKQPNLNRPRSRSHSRSKTNTSKITESYGSKNMLDMEHTNQRQKSTKVVESSKVQSSKEPRKDDRSKRRSRNRSRSRDRNEGRTSKKDDKKSPKRKRRHSTASTNSSSESSGSSSASSRSTSASSSSSASRASSYHRKDSKKNANSLKTSNDGHLKKLSTKPVTEKSADKPSTTSVAKSTASVVKKDQPKGKPEERTKDVARPQESNRDSKKVIEKDVKKSEKQRLSTTEKTEIVDTGVKVKPLLSPDILASRIEKVISVTLDTKKNEDRSVVQKSIKPSTLLEPKSDIKPTHESVKADVKKSSPPSLKSGEGGGSNKETGVLLKGKGESKIVLKMLKPLNKMRKNENSLAEKKGDAVKKEVAKVKPSDSSKPSLMKLKLEAPKNLSPKKVEADEKYEKRDEVYENKPSDDSDRRRSDKLAREEEARVYEDQKIESTRHGYSESEWNGKEASKRRVSPDYYSKYSDSKRSRLSKYEQDRSIERSNDRDLGPPTLDHYSPHRSRSPRSRSHKHERIDGDRLSDPDNLSRSSQHQYDDRYDSHRRLESRVRRSASGQRWDMPRGADILRGVEGDDRYYDKRLSGGYDHRAYKEASYDRGHEKIYDRDPGRDQWNRSYDRRHEDKGDLLPKEIWDDNYRRSDGYKTRSDWEKSHHDARPSDEYRTRRDILLPPPPRIRSSSNLPLDHVPHIDNPPPFPDQDPNLDRSRARGVDSVPPPKDEDTNDVNDILGAADPKEELEPEIESLPSRIPIVDMLDIKWKSLATGGGSQVVSSSTSIIKRWQPATILSKVGISRQFAGDDLWERVRLACQKEQESENENEKNGNGKLRMEKFEFLSDIAILHCNALKKIKQRQKVISDIGDCRRALCARRDLAIRRALCKLDKEELLMLPVQMVDQDLHAQSLQMFQQNKEVPVI